jgi:hypothetical protein
VTQLFALAADPTSATTVYVSGQGAGSTAVIYRGDVQQGPQSWVNLQGGNTNSTQPHTDSRQLVFLNKLSSTLLETDDGGIFALTNALNASSQDGYDRWIDLVGDLHNTEFFSATYDTSNGVLLGGTQDNGTPLQSANSSNWNDINGGDGGFVGQAFDSTVIDPQGNSAPIYVSSNDGFIGFQRYYVQTTQSQQIQLASARGAAAYSGLNNTRSQPGQPTDQQLAGQAPDLPFPFVVSTQDVQQLLLGYNGVYESVESDSSGPIAPGDAINDITPAAMTGVVRSLDYTGPQALVGTNTGQVFLRTTAGGTFTVLTPPNPEPGVRKVLFDARTTNTIYVLYANGHIWRVTNAGSSSRSWDELDGSDVNDPGQLSRLSKDIRTLAIYDPGPGNIEVLLAGGLGGVYRRLLGSGDSCWRTYGKGLPNVVVTDLHYAPLNTNGNGDTLVAATLGRGIWTVANVSATLAKPATLQVNDDAIRPAIIDLRLDPQNNSFLEVIVNGKVEYDAPYAYFSTIAINANGFQDQVQIEDAPVCTQVQVTSGPLGSVTVGKNGTLQGILGNVYVSTSAGLATLTIDDSLDPSNHVTVPVNISSSSVTGLSVGTISYDQASLGALSIQVGTRTAGVSRSVFNVLSTPNSSAIISGLTATTLFSGNNDQVNIGNQGNAQGVNGNLFIQGRGLTTVNVNDAADPTSLPQVTLDLYQDPASNFLYESISNLAPATIYVEDGGVASVTITGGTPSSGGNTYTIANTTSETAVSIKTGAGGDTVGIQGNRGSVVVDPSAGPDTVNIGKGGLVQGISGGITIRPGLANLSVDDSADPNRRTLTVTSQGLDNGLNPSAPFSPWLGYSSLNSLSIKGGTPPPVNGAPAPGNVFNVLGTASGTTTTIAAGAGSDSVMVGNAQSNLDGVVSLRVQGNTGTVVTLDDEANHSRRRPFIGGTFIETTHPQYVISDGWVTRTNQITDTIAGTTTTFSLPPLVTTVSYTNIAGLIVTGGHSGNYFDVQSTAPGTPVTINAGTAVPGDPLNLGKDTVDVGNTMVLTLPVHLLNGIHSLTVNGGTGPMLNLNDQDNVAGRDILGNILATSPTYIVTDRSVVRNDVLTGGIFGNGPIVATIKYGDLASLTINGGHSGNTFNVQRTAAGTPVTINAGAPITGDPLNLGNNTINIGSVADASTGTVASTLDTIKGPLTVNGQGGTTTLNYNDQGKIETGLVTYVVTNNTLTRTGSAVVTYSGIGTVNIRAGDASGSSPGTRNYLVVDRTAAGTTYNIFGGAGVNEFAVGDPNDHTLDHILGEVWLHGQIGTGSPNSNFIFSISDDLNPNSHTFKLTGPTSTSDPSTSGTVQRFADPAMNNPDMAAIHFDGINGGVTLVTGTGAETVNVQSEAPNLLTQILVESSATTVNVSSPSHTVNSILGDLRIQAPSGLKPSVFLDDSGNTNTSNPKTIDLGSDPFFGYLVAGLLPPSSVGRGRVGLALDPSAPVLIRTGAGNDTFRVHDLTGAPTLTLDGGGGSNTLDYSAYTGNIIVDLPLAPVSAASRTSRT